MTRSISFLFLFICTLHFSFSQTDPLIKSGMKKQKEGKHPSAISDFSSAISNSEAEVQKFIKRTEALRSTGDTLMNNEISTGKSFSLPYCLRGISYAATGKNDEALSDFNTALKIDARSGAAYYQRGKLLWSMGKKDEGCMDLGMAGSLGDSLAKEMFGYNFCWKDAVVAYKDAVSKIKLSLFQPALDLIQKALKFCPDSARYMIVRGNCFVGLGKFDQAIIDFNAALVLLPNNADAYFGRGLGYYANGKYQEAFDDIDKTIQLNPKLIDAYLYRAYVCEKLNKIESALFDYKQVQNMRPYDALAFYKSGLLNNSMNNSKSACVDFKKSAALGSTEAADYVKQLKCK
jgi:tetratricopeptide (TPR) repeat protein